jgi:hypothetical protein
MFSPGATLLYWETANCRVKDFCKFCRQICFKEKSNEIFFFSDCFTDGLLPGPLLDIQGLFEFGFEFMEKLVIFD